MVDCGCGIRCWSVIDVVGDGSFTAKFPAMLMFLISQFGTGWIKVRIDKDCSSIRITAVA